MSAAHPELLHEAAREPERPETILEVTKGAEESKRVPQGCSEATIEEGLRLHAGPASLAGQLVSYDDIWCTLVFRMICWLMRHDLNRQDVQVSKGELLGSRMPVYIS
ncbi:hypothetical protein E5D57_012430 [Metarhizium anisopliae]|nr:hypothetical protein E5D57_012430 [Metarhizium anisopliae]